MVRGIETQEFGLDEYDDTTQAIVVKTTLTERQFQGLQRVARKVSAPISQVLRWACVKFLEEIDGGRIKP